MNNKNIFGLKRVTQKHVKQTKHDFLLGLTD